MKSFILAFAILIIAILINGCLFIDDHCHYETKCSYITQCETICDYYGNGCVQVNCHEVSNGCWDEYVCYDRLD